MKSVCCILLCLFVFNDIDLNAGVTDQAEITADFDIDFANMMIDHHKEAINMSEIHIRSGTDTIIRSIAQHIIIEKQNEIEILERLVRQYENEAPENPHGGIHSDGHGSMPKITDENISVQLSGDMDIDFAKMMMAHHEHAIIMAKQELIHGKHMELKVIAQKIIDVSTQKILDFNIWLSSRKH